MRLWHLTRGPWSLGNQPLRDQLKIRIEFKMIFLSVAAPAIIHFELRSSMTNFITPPQQPWAWTRGAILSSSEGPRSAHADASANKKKALKASERCMTVSLAPRT
jgi:hypothetical protein